MNDILMMFNSSKDDENNDHVYAQHYYYQGVKETNIIYDNPTCFHNTLFPIVDCDEIVDYGHS